MNTELKINFLKSIPLFNNLGPVPIARLAESAGTLKFSRGSVVLEAGKHCNYLFIVASGRLEVYKKVDDKTEIILQSLGKGDIFGESYIFDGIPLFAGVRSAENSLVIGIDKLSVVSLARDNAEFCKNYIKYLGARVRDGISREDRLLRVIMASGQGIPEPYSINDLTIKVKEPSSPPPPAAEVNQVNAPEEQEEEGDKDGVFFSKEYACPLCANRFKTLKPRQKYVVVEKADDDFCLYYKTVNPLFYEINVCPRCGYSFNNSTSGPVKAEIKKGLAKTLSGIWKSANYCGNRTNEDAAETFRLAIECQKIMGADDSAMGRLHLKQGWLYRYLGDKDQEHKNLDRALYHLSKSFEKSSSKDPKEEMNLMFLLGQLHLILGDERGAVNWFVRITQHPDKKSYPYIVNRARNSWQEIRKNRN